MASGNTLTTVSVQNNEPPATTFATLDSRNGHLVLDFDAATDESAIFTEVLSRAYAGGGITVNIHYAMSSAITGDVVLTAEFERIGDGQQDIDLDSFAAAQTVTVTVPLTSGNVDIASLAFTNGAQIDSIAVGEAFRIRITRDANNLADTSAGDLELLACELKET